VAKIDVELTAVLHDGKTVLQPGQVVSLERKEAARLAALGMVKPSKKTGKKGDAGNGKKAAALTSKKDVLPPDGDHDADAPDPDQDPDGDMEDE
jgi:hypothetical protein